jgi:hypothetical protein
MTPPRLQAAEATLAGCEPVVPGAPLIPSYLEQVYWWAYVHPNAVTVFEREWLVSAILFGHYGKLRDAALADLGGTVQGSTLQVACAYGNLTPKLRERLAPDARLDVVDILPIQLKNLGKKLPPDPRVELLHGDSSSLACPEASYDQVLLLMRLVFRKLEPYAMDLWNHEIQDFIPQRLQPTSMAKQTYFGGLYQKLVLIR